MSAATAPISKGVEHLTLMTLGFPVWFTNYIFVDPIQGDGYETTRWAYIWRFLLYSIILSCLFAMCGIFFLFWSVLVAYGFIFKKLKCWKNDEKNCDLMDSSIFSYLKKKK